MISGIERGGEALSGTGREQEKIYEQVSKFERERFFSPKGKRGFEKFCTLKELEKEGLLPF